VARRNGIIIERGANLSDAKIESAVEINVGIGAPNL
jgi:hypothetical protein